MNFNNTPIINRFELKVLDIVPQEIGQKLENLGARRILDRSITKTLTFDHDNLRLRKTGKVLRLRQVGTKVFLSIKEGKEGQTHNPFSKVVDAELELNDFNQAFRLFESLGFSAFRYQEKFRTIYLLNNIKVEIDEYPKIPPYFQLSGPSEEELTHLLLKLGYSSGDSVKKSGLEILKHYGLKDVNIIRFEEDKGTN